MSRKGAVVVIAIAIPVLAGMAAAVVCIDRTAIRSGEGDRIDPQGKVFPPVEEEPGDEPQGHFILDRKTGSWCGFDTLAAARAYDEKLPEGSAETAWVRHDGRALISITVAYASEDALANDRYLFKGGALTAMKRTGSYIEAPRATFPFAPDKTGKLVPTTAARDIAAKLTAQGEESYIIDWPAYSALADMPFRSLLTIDETSVTVRNACTPATGRVPR